MFSKCTYDSINKINPEDAFKYLYDSAQSGALESYLLLARAYRYGVGVEINFEESSNWYQKAILQAYVSPDEYMAYLISIGSEEALIRLYNICSASDSPKCKQILPKLYWNGFGVKKDELKGIKLARLMPLPINSVNTIKSEIYDYDTIILVGNGSDLYYLYALCFQYSIPISYVCSNEDECVLAPPITYNSIIPNIHTALIFTANSFNRCRLQFNISFTGHNFYVADDEQNGLFVSKNLCAASPILKIGKEYLNTKNKIFFKNMAELVSDISKNNSE